MTEWIKTSDSMPSKPGIYLVTIESKSGNWTAAVSYDASLGFIWGNTDDIIAWSEMPKPFEEEKTEEPVYVLKDSKLQEALDEISDGDFSKKLQEAHQEAFLSMPPIQYVSVHFGKAHKNLKGVRPKFSVMFDPSEIDLEYSNKSKAEKVAVKIISMQQSQPIGVCKL